MKEADEIKIVKILSELSTQFDFLQKSSEPGGTSLIDQYSAGASFAFRISLRLVEAAIDKVQFDVPEETEDSK